MADAAAADFVKLPVPGRTVDRALVEAYAVLTDDFNPIHLDEDFAARTEFGRPIAHGTAVIAPLWDYLAADLPSQCDVRFVRPTPVGGTVTYWERLDDSGERIFEVRAGDGEVVATVRCRDELR